MVKYVDVEKVFCADCEDRDRCGSPDVFCDVHSMPAADVAPVVRCKDCKYYSIIPHTDLYLCRKSYTGCRAEFFCADGERREDG